MQTQAEVGKYVTDGKHVYPYNAFLDDLISAGKLQYCQKPEGIKGATPKVTYRNPLKYTPEERMEFAQKLNITLGELTNMSPQEFEVALAQIESGTVPVAEAAPTTAGFPT